MSVQYAKLSQRSAGWVCMKPTVPEQHQYRIAKQTLCMSDAMVAIMGSMTKEEARTILRERAGWTQERIEEYENEAS